MKRLLLVGLISLLCGCSDGPGTIKFLEAQGYSNIEITGYRAFIGGDDTYVTGFKATNPYGKKVSGAVTMDFRKGKTIRFD